MKLTPQYRKITARKPAIERYAALLPFHPRVTLACRYAAYMNHVISDHVSLGSQLQYVPHA